MDLKIANRLLEYRKNAGLSQDQLADKIGVSRQAVSKWERGEASPDIENLIALSEIYEVSLDELVKGKNPVIKDEKPKKHQIDIEETDISFDNFGFSVKKGNKEQRVNFGWTGGVHVNLPGTSVHIDKNGVSVEENGHIFHKKKKKKRSKHKQKNFFNQFPYPFLTVLVYLIFGFLNICGGWAYGWLVFLTIPLYYTLITAICNRDASAFAYPVFIVLVYLAFGFFMNLWHPMWILFLTIPLYYFLCEFIKKIADRHFK